MSRGPKSWNCPETVSIGGAGEGDLYPVMVDVMVGSGRDDGGVRAVMIEMTESGGAGKDVSEGSRSCCS